MINERLLPQPEQTAQAANTFASENFNTVLYTGNGGSQRIGGYINRGAVFNGSSSYIDLNGSVISVGSFSISLWVNWDNVTNQSRAIHLGNGDNFSDISIFALNGNATVRFADSGSNYRDVSFSVSTNQWYHISMTYDISNNNYKVYLNGTQQGSTIVASGFTTLENYGAIGARIGSGGTSYPMRGKIDQVRMFNKALSSSEVTTLYGETHASTTISTTDIFNDNSGLALYQLDGNANDTGGTSGYIGEGGIFNGSSSYIENTNASIWSASWTISLWFKTSNNSGRSPLFVFGRGSWTDGIELQSASANTVAGSYAEGTKYFVKNVSVNLDDNNWHHYCTTYDSSSDTIKLYIDGNEETGLTTGTGNSRQGSGYRIGRFFQTPEQWATGKIDQVRIYDRALSSSEATTLYGETASSNITISDLVAYYPMEGTSLDQEGSYHGTDTNVEYNYNGTASNVTYQEATKFSPDLVWIKNRDTSGKWHSLTDSVRGAGKRIFSNETNAELTDTYDVQSFDSNGFTIGNGDFVSRNNESHVAWCFNAGTDAPALNEQGSIDSTVKANQDAGFSIVKWTGNGTNGATIGHGLSNSPEIIITKGLSNPTSWIFGIGGVSGFGVNDYVTLQTTAAKGSTTTFYQAYGTDTFTVGVSAANEMNKNSSNDYISYCFHSVDGYQKVGSYSGNGSATGNFVETGFEPAFVMIKRTDAAGFWVLLDNDRSQSNPRNAVLYANAANAESTAQATNFYSNGFQPVTVDSDVNASGTYIYLAIAADPDTTTPTVEDSFEVVTYTGNGGTQSIDTGFKPDLVWLKGRDTSGKWNVLYDSIRGATKMISSNETNAEQTYGSVTMDSNGFTLGSGFGDGNTNGENYVAWCWKAGDHDDNLPQINTEGTIDSVVSVNDAAGFSIVKFAGPATNVTSTVGHGLSQAPELVITKILNSSVNWYTSIGGITGNDNDYLSLNTTDAVNNNPSFVFGPHSSTTFTTSQAFSGNNPSIAYCFTSITGYQKVGSYTGTGASGNTVTTGFSPKFVMIKDTTNAGNWIIHSKPPTTTNPSTTHLRANSSAGEDSGVNEYINFDSNGFTIVGTGGNVNLNNDVYLYLAIA